MTKYIFSMKILFFKPRKNNEKKNTNRLIFLPIYWILPARMSHFTTLLVWHHFMFREDRELSEPGRQRLELVIVGESCKAIFWPTSGIKGRTLIALGCQQRATILSTSAVSHCRSGSNSSSTNEYFNHLISVWAVHNEPQSVKLMCDT